MFYCKQGALEVPEPEGGWEKSSERGWIGRGKWAGEVRRLMCCRLAHEEARRSKEEND